MPEDPAKAEHASAVAISLYQAVPARARSYGCEALARVQLARALLMDNSTTGIFGGVKGQAAPNKGRKFPAEPLTGAEVEAILSTCSAMAPTGIRNRALIVLLWRSGLRIAEALALKVSDIDPERGTVRVLRGKGSKPRTVGLDPGALAVVQRWTDVRKARGIRNGHLICTLVGGTVSAQYVRALLQRLAAKAGIDKRVTPHQLRHSMAADLEMSIVA